jgi:hypothetical protein
MDFLSIVFIHINLHGQIEVWCPNLLGKSLCNHFMHLRHFLLSKLSCPKRRCWSSRLNSWSCWDKIQRLKLRHPSTSPDPHLPGWCQILYLRCKWEVWFFITVDEFKNSCCGAVFWAVALGSSDVCGVDRAFLWVAFLQIDVCLYCEPQNPHLHRYAMVPPTGTPPASTPTKHKVPSS